MVEQPDRGIAPPPNPATTSHLLSTHRALIDTLTSFLTVCTHHILFLRHVYPPLSFLSTRAYNYPVRQNRHPAVCAWINDAIASISDQLFKNTVSAISLCIYECASNRVLERWTFDLLSFPSVAKRDRDVPFTTPDAQEDSLPTKVNLVDLEATFRATLSRITTFATRLKTLPAPPSGPECSFTLTIELASSTADRPVGRLGKEERKWIVAEPDSLTPTTTESSLPNNTNDTATKPPKPNPEGKTHPIRRLSATPLHIELYVTESAAKFTFDTPGERTPAVRAAEMSYGAGSGKFAAAADPVFDPAEGYDDIEGTDLNRKPGVGRGME